MKRLVDWGSTKRKEICLETAFRLKIRTSALAKTSKMPAYLPTCLPWGFWTCQLPQSNEPIPYKTEQNHSKRHRCKEKTLDFVGESEGGMIWENSTETRILPYVKQIASPGSMHKTGCSGPVHWDNPEGWDKEGGGRGVQDRGHMYTHRWFMWMYGKNHYNTVK